MDKFISLLTMVVPLVLLVADTITNTKSLAMKPLSFFIKESTMCKLKKIGSMVVILTTSMTHSQTTYQL